MPLSGILGFLNMCIICLLSIYVLAIFIKYFKVISPGIFRTYVTSMIKAIKHNIRHSFPQFYIINSIGDNVQFSQHSGMILIFLNIKNFFIEIYQHLLLKLSFVKTTYTLYHPWQSEVHY